MSIRIIISKIVKKIMKIGNANMNYNIQSWKNYKSL